MADDATTKRQGLPLPPLGTRLRDPRGIAWDVIAHEDGRARLVSVVDPELRRMATAERLSDFAVVRTKGR